VEYSTLASSRWRDAARSPTCRTTRARALRRSLKDARLMHGQNPVLRLDRRLRTGGQRAGHTTQENVRCAEIARIEKQGPLSVRRSSCLQHGAAWHAYLLMCTVTISPCPWLRARITCNEDDGRERRAFDSVSAESEQDCVRTIALRCVADPQHLGPPLFGPSGPSPSEKNARGLGSFKKAS
jgi:hypothetical protein